MKRDVHHELLNIGQIASLRLSIAIELFVSNFTEIIITKNKGVMLAVQERSKYFEKCTKV